MSHEKKNLCFRFNRKPKKGVQFLQEQRLLGNTPTEIAEWLLTNDRLDKTGIGDFLGDSDDLSKEVRLESDCTIQSDLFTYFSVV
jgi:Sec7-like guanine-nucleotide exchange factor